MDDPETLDRLFREAVSAIDAGDVPPLERLLAAHPRLVRDRLDSPGDWLRDKIGGAIEGFFEKPALGTRDKAEHATPLEWAEYYRGEHEHDERGMRYAEIAAYLRDQGGRP